MLFKRTYTEEELVKGCIRNERRFQELLYRRYFDKMFAMCRKHVTNEDEAFSILNNGFLRVFTKLDLYGFKGSLEGWIRRIIYHAMIEYLRDRNKYMQFIVLDEPQDRQDRQHGALQQMYHEDIVKLIDKVPATSRRVFELYAIEGYTHREIGEMLGISENTSKWHLANARTVLRKAVQHSSSSKTYAG